MAQTKEPKGPLEELAEIQKHWGSLQVRWGKSKKAPSARMIANEVIQPLADMLYQLAQSAILLNQGQVDMGSRVEQCEFFLMPMATLVPPRAHLAHLETAILTVIKYVNELAELDDDIEPDSELAARVSRVQTSAAVMSQLVGLYPLLGPPSDEELEDLEEELEDIEEDLEEELEDIEEDLEEELEDIEEELEEARSVDVPSEEDDSQPDKESHNGDRGD